MVFPKGRKIGLLAYKTYFNIAITLILWNFGLAIRHIFVFLSNIF